MPSIHNILSDKNYINIKHQIEIVSLFLTKSFIILIFLNIIVLLQYNIICIREKALYILQKIDLTDNFAKLTIEGLIVYLKSISINKLQSI